jgi:hypothetical protein
MDASQLLLLILVAEDGFRNPALQGHETWLIILVTIIVNHNQHLTQVRKDNERFSNHQMRILKSNGRREQRLRHTPAPTHPVQTDHAASIAQEVQVIIDELRRKNTPRRKKRFQGKLINHQPSTSPTSELGSSLDYIRLLRVPETQQKDSTAAVATIVIKSPNLRGNE